MAKTFTMVFHHYTYCNIIFMLLFSCSSFIYRLSANSVPLSDQPTDGHRLVISPTGETTNQPAKQAFFLTCKGSGGDPTLFTDLKWFDPQNEEITSVYTRDRNPDIRTEEILTGHLLLHFQKPKPDNSGLYKCKGLVQRSDVLEAQIQIQFFEDVSWEDCPEIQALVKGQTGERIRCRATANPKPNIQWTKDGKTLERESRYILDSDGIRINEIVNEEDGGRYHVRALVTETGRLHDQYITVQVYVTPEITALPPFGGIEGEQATLQCEAKGTPEPIYSWLDPNSRNLSTVGGYFVDRNTGTLTITRVKKITDRGDFTCIAENAAGKVERKTNFQVIVKPTINSFQNVSFDVSRDSKLECRASGEPRPIITIRKDGNSRAFVEGDTRVSFEHRNENEETILIMTLAMTQRSDDGLYYCRAENSGGSAERVGHLQVQFPPDLSQTPLTHVKTWNLKPVNITCVADSIPNATINWWYRGMILANGRDNIYHIDDSIAGISRLHIRPEGAPGGSHRDIYGSYRCEAINPLGKKFIDIQFDQAYPPAPILEIRHDRITPTSITFKLIGPGNDGGLPVKTIHAQYREENQLNQALTHSWPAAAGDLISGTHGPYFLDALRPRTKYVFRFSAENDVGIGDYSSERNIQTLPESRPDPPKFHNLPWDNNNNNEIVSSYSDQFTASWTVPSDNGRRIQYFEVKYYPVMKSDSGWNTIDVEPKMSTVSLSDDTPGAYTLKNLHPNTYYKMELRAYNELGYSDTESIIFRTSESGSSFDDGSPQTLTTSSASLGLVIGIVIIAIIIILVIMDVIFFIRYKVGALYFLRTHVCNTNSTASDIKVKTVDDGKGSQKSATVEISTDGHSDNGKTEVDNPAYDNRTNNMVNEEQSPMLVNGSRGGRSDGVGSRTNIAKDSAV